MAVVVWDGITQESTLQQAGVALRHALADAAKTFDWVAVLDIVENNPDLINATRLGGSSLFTPLHQSALGGASAEVVKKLLRFGAFRTVRTTNGERPIDIAMRKERDDIVPVLAPPMRHEVPLVALGQLEQSFHEVIRSRVERLVDEHSLRLPALDVLTELEEPRMWFGVPGMYGGFHFWLEASGPEPVLISESWCRVAGGSGERHEIRPGSWDLTEKGFV